MTSPNLTSRQILTRVKGAGVVGAGGAGFPTHRKLACKVELLIANGAECEPLLASDKVLLLEQGGEVLAGAHLAARVSGARRIILAVKEKETELRRSLERTVGQSDAVELVTLPDVYPIGDERELVWRVARRDVPPDGFPPDAGVLVQNVTTLAWIAAAVRGNPVVSRLVTVTGFVARPSVISTPIGASVGELIEACGGSLVAGSAVLMNGAMMGRLAESEKEPILKTTAGVMVLPSDHRLVLERRADPRRQSQRAAAICQSCAKCTDLCPRARLGYQLAPHLSVRAMAFSGAYPTPSAHLCCECGLCALYACDSGLSPRAVNRAMKATAPLPAGGAAPISRDVPTEGIPAGRLVRHLALERFAEQPLERRDLPLPAQVRIMLCQGVGSPAVPSVRAGEAVVAGQQIGKPPTKTLGAGVHASIAGEIQAVSDDSIVIRRG